MDGGENMSRTVQLINEIWNRVEPYYEVLKKVFIITVIVCNICCIALCISVFMFGSIYFYHMPTIQHKFPLHFNYNRSCMQQHKVVERGLRWDKHLSSAYTKECFPVAHVGLSYPTNALLLQEGQSYSVLIKVELPETPENLGTGMFMVNMEVNGVSTNSPDDGEYRWSKRRNAKAPEFPLSHSASKPMIMRYKSPLLRYGFTMLFWPFLMFDFLHESQVLDEMLFENLMLDQKSYNWTASIYLESPSIEVYSAQLDVVAQFSGIQYLLYRWPVVSFLLGTFTFFVPTFFVIAVMVYFVIWKFYVRPIEANPRRNLPQRRLTPPPAANPVEEVHPALEDTDHPPDSGPASPSASVVSTPRSTCTVVSPSHQPTTRTEPTTIPPSSSSDPPRAAVADEHHPLSDEPPSSSGFTDESSFTPLSVRRHSRTSSSSSSSIEMISQPSNFSHLDDDDLYTTDLQTSRLQDNDPPTEEPTNNQSEATDQGIRRRLVE